MPFAAADQAGAFLLADFNVAEDLFDLTAVDLGAHLRVFQPGQADFDAVESFGQFGDELVVDPFLTKMREPAQQTWPWLKRMPSWAPSMAMSQSQSSKKIFADLPPSSSVAGMSFSWAAL